MALKTLRIDFQVREVADDGMTLLDPADSRYVTLGDFIKATDIRDFFDRCGLAIDNLYHHRVSGVVLVMRDKPVNKIASIKLLRDLTRCTLKDAKDLIEGAPGTQLVAFRDGRAATNAAADFYSTGGMHVEIVHTNLDVAVAAGVFLYHKDGPPLP